MRCLPLSQNRHSKRTFFFRKVMLFLKTLKKAIFVCTKSKTELLIFAFFCFLLHFLNVKMDSYSWERDGSIVMYRFPARKRSKTPIFVAISEFLTFKWLLNSGSFDFFILLDRMLPFVDLSARKAYFNSIHF